MSHFLSNAYNILTICHIYMLKHSINFYILNIYTYYLLFYYTIINTRTLQMLVENVATLVGAYNLAITEIEIFCTIYVKIMMFGAFLWKQWALVSDWRSQ